jgi:hypothetical protein
VLGGALILGTACLGERALDPEAVRAALPATGLSRLLLVVPEGVSTPGAAGLAGLAGLRGAPVVAVRVGWSDLGAGLQVAAASRASHLVIELPRLLGLERACRELHALGHKAPGLPWSVATPDAGPLAEPRQLALLLEDLSAQRPGYWHRPSRAHLLGHGDVGWLEACGRFLTGASLDDVVDGRPGAPPGLGAVDFRRCAELLPASALLALDVDAVADPRLLRFTCEKLRADGFP